jgi:hypothetical protein
MSENDENEETEEEEDILGRTSFPESIMDDCDEYYLKCVNHVEDTNIVENKFLENKRFKYDDENCSNKSNNNNINNLGKELNNKRNYFLNYDIKIRKKSYPKHKQNIKKVNMR